MNYRMKRLHSARETVVRTSELASSKSEGGNTAGPRKTKGTNIPSSSTDSSTTAPVPSTTAMNSKTTASAESTTSANSASTIDATSNDSSSRNTASNVIATPTTSNQTIPGSAVTSTTSLPNGSSASPTASGSASLSSTGNETQSLLVSHGNIAGADNAEPHPALNDGCSACGIKTITHQNSTSSNVQTGTPTQTTAESTKGAGNSTQDPIDIQIPATNTTEIAFSTSSKGDGQPTLIPSSSSALQTQPDTSSFSSTSVSDSSRGTESPQNTGTSTSEAVSTTSPDKSSSTSSPSSASQLPNTSSAPPTSTSSSSTSINTSQIVANISSTPNLALPTTATSLSSQIGITSTSLGLIGSQTTASSADNPSTPSSNSAPIGVQGVKQGGPSGDKGGTNKPDKNNNSALSSGLFSPTSGTSSIPTGSTNTGGNSEGSVPQHSKIIVSPAVIAIVAIAAIIIVVFCILSGLRVWNKRRRGGRSHRLVKWTDKMDAISCSEGGFLDENATYSSLPLSKKERSRLSNSGAYLTIMQSHYAHGPPSRSSSVSPSPYSSAPVDSLRRASDGSSRFSFISDDSRRTSNTLVDISSRSPGVQSSHQPLSLAERDNPQLSPIALHPWTPSDQWFSANNENANDIYAPTNHSHDPEASHDSIPPRLRRENGGSHARKSGVTTNPFLEPPINTLASIANHHIQSSIVKKCTIVDHAQGSSVGQTPFSQTKTPSTGHIQADTISTVETVKRTFKPSRKDELEISRGDKIFIMQSFDDGWLRVEKTDTRKRGFIPKDCLMEAVTPPLP